MKYTVADKLSVLELTKLLEEAKNAELCRNIEAFRDVFSELWTNIEIDPDFSEFPEFQQAELFRLTGFFLNYYGKAKNLISYQERSKDLLTQAITLFSKLNKPDRVAEANVMLAICYFNEGAIDDCEFILEQTKSSFEGQHLHPVYLQICINQLVTKISKRDYPGSFQIINEIRVPMEFCQDKRLCGLFHQKVAMTYKHTGNFQKAISHYNEAIRFAEETENYLFIALNKNNLANLYLKTREFELAHSHVNLANDIAREYGLVGWLPHFFDTKAVIYFAEGHSELALQMIGEAISIFQKGEDANGLTESMWNKCQFLLNLNQKEEAILLFNELIPIASLQMGEFAVKGFVKEFARLIHIKQDGSLDEEVRRFKRVEIVNAIREAKYNLNEAAAYLKINPTILTKTIDKEFPELYDELNLIHQSKSGSDFEIVETKNNFARNISELKMDASNFVFENAAPKTIKTFYFSAEKMLESFGIDQDSVVTVLPTDKISADEFTLVEDLSQNLYAFGKLHYDSDLDLYYLFEKDGPTPISTNEFKVIGQAFAYCPFDKIDDEELHFQTLNL